jgi:hypothetical protein
VKRRFRFEIAHAIRYGLIKLLVNQQFVILQHSVSYYQQGRAVFQRVPSRPDDDTISLSECPTVGLGGRRLVLFEEYRLLAVLGVRSCLAIAHFVGPRPTHDVHGVAPVRRFPCDFYKLLTLNVDFSCGLESFGYTV